MPVSKGGSSNNQNQNQFGSYTGNGSTSGTQTQDTIGTQTGTQTGTMTGGSTTSAVAPDGWQNSWQGFQPGAGGFNPTQQGAVNWFQNTLGRPDPANLAGATAGTNWAGNYFQDQAANRTAPTLRNLSQIDPSTYSAPANVGAQQVQAQQGAAFMDAYKNPYLNEVLDSSLSDYDVGTGRAANAFRLNSIAGGGASAYGANPVGAAIFAGEANRGRGALGAGIRSNAFTTAAGLGMQDASRALQADMANQGASLGADQFNYQGQQSRNMFDSGQGMAYNDQRDRTVRDFAGTQGQLASLGTNALGVGQGLASGLFGMGGTGQGQNLDWLNAALPLFGQANTNNQTSSGTQTGTSIGSSSGTTAGTSSESGSTAGNSAGSSRGKSGGVSLG